MQPSNNACMKSSTDDVRKCNAWGYLTNARTFCKANAEVELPSFLSGQYEDC